MKIDFFKDSIFTESEQKEIIAAMEQTPEQLAAGLEFIRRLRLYESDWIESRLKELNDQARSAQTENQILLIKANIGHFINDLTGLKVILQKQNKPIQRIDYCLTELTGIKELIEGRREYLRIKPNMKIKNPQLKFSDYLICENPIKLIFELKKIFPTGKNKEAAIMVTALIENKLLIMPTNRIDIIKAIQKEWNTDFKPEGFNKPYREIERSKKKGYKGEIIQAINKVNQISC